jgi:hypothetical protein
MVLDVAGVGASLVLASLAAFHVYWAFGGRTGRVAAVPEVDGRALFSPSKTATLVVALLLALSAVIVVGGVDAWEPRVLFEIGCAGIAAVLLVRSIGDRRYIGLFKRLKGTDFARRDTWIYSPLCLVLAIAAVTVALSR